MKASIKSLLATAATAAGLSANIAQAQTLTVEGVVQYTAPIGGNLINQDGYAPNGVSPGTPFSLALDFMNWGVDQNALPNISDHHFPQINYTLTIGAHSFTGTQFTQMITADQVHLIDNSGQPRVADIFSVLLNFDEVLPQQSPLQHMSLEIYGDSEYFSGDDVSAVLPNISEHFLSHAENFLAAPTIIPGDSSTRQTMQIRLAEGDVVGNINSITYIPAPGAAALMGAAALAALRRRRSKAAPVQVMPANDIS